MILARLSMCGAGFHAVRVSGSKPARSHGSRVLKERGLSFLPKSYHRNFAHELMPVTPMAGIARVVSEAAR